MILQKLKAYQNILAGFLTDDHKRSTIIYNKSGWSTDRPVIEKGAVLRSLLHLKPDKFGGPDGIHYRFIKALEDIIAEALAILLDVFEAV